MLSDEVASVLSQFFDRIGPSHDEIRVLIQRAGLQDLDPERINSGVTGKMRRVRGVLYGAVTSAPTQGEKLVQSLIDSVRACGGFRVGNENCPGEEVIGALRSALRNTGVDLDAEGIVRPMHLESLEGIELTEALQSYVSRARRGGWDAALVVGTSKSLEEAAARHLIRERTGSYPSHADFPTTLYQAYVALELSAPTYATIEALPSNARAAMQQAIFMLGIALNRLRNAEGEGHGRPDLSTITQPEAKIAGAAAALVTQLLLDWLDE